MVQITLHPPVVLSLEIGMEWRGADGGQEVRRGQVGVSCGGAGGLPAQGGGACAQRAGQLV